MLTFPHDQGRDPYGPAGHPAGPEPQLIDLDRLLAAVRRQARVVGVCAGLAVAAGAAYLLAAAPQYTATVKILIDPRSAVGSGQSADLSQLGIDSGAVDSQVEVLTSDKIVTSVIDGLDLLDNPRFVDLLGSTAGSAIRFVKGVLTLDFLNADADSGETDAAYALKRSAVGAVLDNLKVERVGITYVLDVRYTSPHAAMSRDIANAIAEAYLTDQLDSRYDAARRASVWLQDRIDEVRLKSIASDLEVQKFRSDNGLIATDGELVSEQQLAQISSALIVARAETARAEARHQRIQSILADRRTEAAVSESLDSPVINSLREKYVDASKREAEIARQLGGSHLAAVRLRSEMEEYSRLIFEELGRIAQSYESEYKVALAKEESLKESMSGLVGSVAATNKTQVRLRELEQEAESYRALYETLLRRHQETVQQQSFPITEARIITPAVQPIVPSGPRKPMVLVLCAMIGVAVGAGVGVLREFGERGLRTARQVRDELGQDCIGLLPAVHPDVDAPRAAADPDAGPPMPWQVEPDPIMRHVLERPGSQFAETLRAVKVAIDIHLADQPTRIVGIASVLPREGKSTVSKGLATLIASMGNRTLLVDGDLRNPALSRNIAPHAAEGLIEALRDGRPVGELYAFESSSALFVLPTVTTQPVFHRDTMLSSRLMKDLLEEAGSVFDYVLIDLPPMGPVVDVRAAATLIHGFVLVVEWGTTSSELVRSTLESNRDVRDKCVGIVLNNVDPEKLKLYGDAGSTGLYADYYAEAGWHPDGGRTACASS